MSAKEPAARPASALRSAARTSAPRLISSVSTEGVLGTELTRLQNALRTKEREGEEFAKEVAALKAGVANKDRCLQQRSSECDGLKERALLAEGQLSSSTKELASLKVDKRKLESSNADQGRQLEKLQQQLAALQKQSPGIGIQVAALQSEARSAKAERDQAQDDNRALDNIIRSKDKELGRLAKRVAEVDRLDLASRELENVVRSVQASLDEARAQNKTLAQVNRNREADVAKLTRELEAARDSLNASQASLAASSGNLKATEARAAELEQEVQVLRDDLARTSAVAARVAASEVKGGSKAEGTVPVVQHMEEVKHLTGEVTRLKERIALLERDLAVAHDIKEKFKAAAEGRPPSRRSSISGTAIAPGGLSRASLGGGGGGLLANTLLTASMGGCGGSGKKAFRSSLGGGGLSGLFDKGSRRSMGGGGGGSLLDSSPSRQRDMDQQLETLRARMGRASLDADKAADGPEENEDDTQPDATGKPVEVV